MNLECEKKSRSSRVYLLAETARIWSYSRWRLQIVWIIGSRSE